MGRKREGRHCIWERQIDARGCQIQPWKALDVINGLAKLPLLSSGDDGQPRLCSQPPVPVAYSLVSLGSYLQSTVTDAKRWSW